MRRFKSRSLVPGPVRLNLFTHPACAKHVPPGHPERPARLAAALSGVARWGGPVERHGAPEATRDEVLALHPRGHWDRVRGACDGGGTWFDADTFAGPGSWEAALRAAGGAIAAGRAAADGVPSLALVRPPGHHATAGRAMGFCLFNNVALAAQALAASGLRVAVLDVDVHHGNGTQDLFAARDDVLYVSVHQWPLYPGSGRVDETGSGRGEGFTVNLPVPAGTGHVGWMEVLEKGALPVLKGFAPDVALVSAGYDGHQRDPLAGLRLVASTYHGAVAALGGVTRRIAVVLEGGYDVQALEASVAATCAALAGQEDPMLEAVVDGVRPWPAMAEAVTAALGSHWDLRHS